MGGKVMFAAGDPRLALAVPLDARVHFALVCGAKSCPPIRVFQTKNLEYVHPDCRAVGKLCELSFGGNNKC